MTSILALKRAFKLMVWLTKEHFIIVLLPGVDSSPRCGSQENNLDHILAPKGVLYLIWLTGRH